MWKDLGLNIPIEEGTYWLNNQVIKGFDVNGNTHNFYRLKVGDDLSISVKKHADYLKSKSFELESWEQTICRLSDRLNDLEQYSLSMLKEHGLNTQSKIIDTSSTGKDSMVKTYLATKAGLKFKTYFNFTTIEVADVFKMAKEFEYEIIMPEKKHGGFYQYIDKYQTIPSRLNRFCCTKYKEDATINLFDKDKDIIFLFGMRNDESQTRSDYLDVWRNHKWNTEHWTGLLPIRHWTDLDIWLYTLREGIRINPKYKKGYDRVGCAIACPNYTKTTWVLDKYWYPTEYNRWHNKLKQDFLANNKWITMNCTIEEYLAGAWTGGILRSEPNEQVISEYSEYSNLDISVSEKYFNKYCSNGCINSKKQPLKIKSRDVLAMNMKLFGIHIEKFQCKKCLMKEFGWSKDDWNDKVKSFKTQGCLLF